MRTIIVIGFFFFNTLQGWAQEYNVQNILESNIEKTNLITWEKETNINVKSTDNVQIEHKHIYSRINQNSPRDQYKIYYSKFSKVKKINARIIDENGNEIRKIKKSEIQDEARYDGISLHLDSRIKVIPVSHNQYPYTVEISYQEDYKGIMFYPDYLIQNYGEHIVKSSFSASVPKEMNLFYKNFNTQLKPTIIEDGDQKIFQWSVESKTPIINESFTKSHYEILPMVITAPSKFSIGNYEGTMDSWQNLGHFLSILNDDNKTILSPQFEQKIKSLTSNAENNLEKISILYKFLQENTRYVSIQVGVGSWQTYDALYVEKNQFGDCKALSNYMRTMLQTIGIESKLALVNGGSSEFKFSEDFAKPKFNHMILYIPDEDLWLECTSNKCPVGYLGSFTSDKTSLVLDGEKSFLTKTPSLIQEQDLENIKANISVDAEGNAQIACDITLIGVAQEAIRTLNFDDQKEVNEYLKGFFDGANVKLLDYNLDIKPESDTAVVKVNYTVIRYASVLGNRIFIPLNSFHKRDYIPEKNESRVHDIYSNANYVLENKTQIQIPEGYKVESAPKDFDQINHDAGTFSFAISQGDKVITSHKIFTRNPIQLPKDQYSGFRDFYIDISKKDKLKLVLVKE